MKVLKKSLEIVKNYNNRQFEIFIILEIKREVVINHATIGNFCLQRELFEAEYYVIARFMSQSLMEQVFKFCVVMYLR